MESCNHRVPAFGCESCIASERTSTIDEFVRTAPKPPCSECGGPTHVQEKVSWAMIVEYACDDEDCDGLVEVKVR